MYDVLQKIVDALLDFARWLWGSLVPPKHKPWCAVLYFVGQEDADRLPVHPVLLSR